MPKKSLVVLSILFLAGFIALAQDTSKPAQSAQSPQATQSNQPAQSGQGTQATAPAESKIPPEAAKQQNPVKPTAESIAAGKRMYGYDCAMCHGETGDGKGDLAGDMKLQLTDFREAKSMQGVTDGELFYIIKNGKGQMPAEGTRAKPEQIWNMVNFIRSLAKGQKTETAAKASS